MQTNLKEDIRSKFTGKLRNMILNEFLKLALGPLISGTRKLVLTPNIIMFTFLFLLELSQDATRGHIIIILNDIYKCKLNLFCLACMTIYADNFMNVFL